MGFRVLGPLEVVGDEEVELGGPQQRIVMALLVLRANETVSTDALVEAVWEARPPATALQVVRTYVYRLRRAMSSAGVRARLVGRPPGYRVEVDPDDVDAARFERLARQGRHEAGAGDAEAASATLTAALGLWRGPFLADLAERPCFRPVAVRFEELRIATVEDRIEVDLALGRHANVAGELEELTARHPFREHLWGQRIVALYRSGRQADALAAYQAVRTALVEQLGIAPGPALQRLERDVLGQVEDLGSWRPSPGRRDGPTGLSARHGDLGRAEGEPGREREGGTGGDIGAVGAAGAVGSTAPGRAALPVALAGGPESRPLVGRTDELSRLDRSFRAVQEGKFQAVLVAGAPGIGKTALASRCARVAHDNGALVVLGRSEDDLAVPYHPLRCVIRQWIAGPGTTELDGMADADAALLSRVAPELRDHRTVAREPSPPDDDIDRLWLYEAIGRWVAGLAARGPALVVLEDLHWADHATLLALRHLLRHPPAAGAMVLMTYRDTEPDAAPGLASLVADAGHDGHVVHIEVAGLRHGEVVELLRGELGPLDEAGNAFADRLTRRTGGNPLFIHETLRHLGRRDRKSVV